MPLSGLLAVRRQLILLAALLFLAIGGILLHTLTIIHGQKSDGVVIDLAGRQRMLHQKHLKDVVLVSQGFPADYTYTRRVLTETLAALTNGGPALLNLGEDQTVELPPAPTDRLRRTLHEQRELMEAFAAEADAFLALPKSDPSYPDRLQALQSLGEALLDSANEAVKLFERHSSAKVDTMIGWEVTAAVLIGLLAVYWTWQVMRANQALARESAERLRTERELRASETRRLEALRQSDALKSALLSSVSHELRTPLAAIKAMVSSLIGTEDRMSREVREEFLEGIDEDIDYLNRLVDNLLDMSKIEAGSLVPQREWHLVEDLVEGAIRRVGKVHERGPLELDLAENLPSVFVDGVQIQQVLVNLLDNALKYSTPGTPIRLEARRADQAVDVRVSNVGEGIAPEDQSRVFERFYRVRDGRSRRIPGTGLGLAVCKALVEAHGGRIWIQSGTPARTSVVFSIPIVKEPALPLAFGERQPEITPT